MSNFLSHIHTEIRRARLSRKGATHHPKDVPRHTHKEYSRMHRTPLPPPQKLTYPLTEALEKRRSSAGDPRIPLTLSECGNLLGHSLRVRTESWGRNYPSGGALYPIETYLISTGLEGHRPAVFHYQPTAHALECVWELPQGFDMKELVRKPESLRFSSLLVFTSVWARSSAKYGDLSYAHALLEAGHMSENMLLMGAALGLCLRPMAGFNDDLLVRLLDLDEEMEQPIHSITLGKLGTTLIKTQPEELEE